VSWDNYDDVCSQLLGAGLILDRELAFDARIQRWKVDGEDRERRGWSRLKEWTSRRGVTYIVGNYGVWHGTDDGSLRIQLPHHEGEKALTSDEVAAMRAAQKEAQRRLAAERRQEAETAGRWAASLWAHARPCVEHEYLARKQIQSHGLRVLETLDGLVIPGLDDSNTYRLQQAAGALLVPMHNKDGQVCGLQFIYPKGHPRRAKIERDKEFWPSGMAMGGTFGVIGHQRRNGVMLIAEGYATAASLHEATGLTVAYAFSANNVARAGKEIRKAYSKLRLLFCADDDYQTKNNPGVTAAAQACAEIEGAQWIAPDFTDDAGNDRRAGKKLTDFNDLHQLTGLLPVLATQITARLDALGWRDAATLLASNTGDEASDVMPSQISVDDAALRFWGTYGLGGKTLFDEKKRRLVHKDDVLNLLPPRSWDDLKRHPKWRVAYETEIGFDPTDGDPQIRCNLFGGWPTVPRKGSCSALLALLYYLCSNESNPKDVADWILKWLAYPLQHRGAKMHSAIVVHGPQGTGKSRFFEAVCSIYGEYGRVLGQDAIEDKFNADWAEKKLFILADEVLARQDLYHIKNRLKGFITGTTIRVNPKNVAAHTEKNQMNICFLSNEKMPLLLEEDDRRHFVIFVPEPDPILIADVNEEIEQGGIEALHWHLLHLNLGDFKPWTRPPSTSAKTDLVQLSLGSEERFLKEWSALEIEGPSGDVLPFCPCLGSTLYASYERWCKQQGEFRPRPANQFINFLGKRPGWSAGMAQPVWKNLNDRTPWRAKMVIPSDAALTNAAKHPGFRDDLAREKFSSKMDWLTACRFAFDTAVEAHS